MNPNTTPISTRPPLWSRRVRNGLAVGGPLAVAAIGWASTGVRDTMAIANVALVMAVVTVAIASVDWRAGLTTSIVAALALNYFHTEPVHSLRITAQADVVAVLLLASIGIAASAATALRVRSLARERHRSRAGDRRTSLSAASTRDRPVDAVWTEAVEAACGGLSLVNCRVEPVGASTLPVVARQRAHPDDPDTFVLPDGGAVAALGGTRRGHHVVLTPRDGVGALELDRRLVFAFVDQLELVLDATVASMASTSRPAPGTPAVG